MISAKELSCKQNDESKNNLSKIIAKIEKELNNIVENKDYQRYLYFYHPKLNKYKSEILNILSEKEYNVTYNDATPFDTANILIKW